MREVTISREPHRLQGPLSEKIGAIRSRFTGARDGDAPIGVEEAEAIDRDMRSIVRDVRRLEDAQRTVNNAVPVAFGLVCQTEDELKVLRYLLSAHHTGPLDPDHQIAGAFARSRAFLAEAEAVFLGRAK